MISTDFTLHAIHRGRIHDVVERDPMDGQYRLIGTYQKQGKNWGALTYGLRGGYSEAYRSTAREAADEIRYQYAVERELTVAPIIQGAPTDNAPNAEIAAKLAIRASH